MIWDGERATVVGIDLATGNVRVIAVDIETGDTIVQVSAPLPGPYGGDGVREQDADYAGVVRALITEVTARLGNRADDICALSITGTSGTIVPVDVDGLRAGPAVLYNDMRGADGLARLADAGFALRPSAALARTAWLHEVRPAARYVFTTDVVIAGLAGELLPTDTSHALKSGIDPVAGTWDEAALETLGLPREKLPELVPPGRIIGAVSDAACRALGLPLRVAIVSGMTDGCTSQLATGAADHGDTVGVLGTTLVLKAVSSTEVTDARSGIYSHVAPDGAFWAGGASNVGAGSLSRGPTAGLDVREADQQARQLGPAATVCYPLTGIGERFPVSRADLGEFMVTLSGNPAGPISAAERYRSILEGVAFVERLGLEKLRALDVPRGEHRVSGGGSSSGVWNVIRASVLGHRVLVPRDRSSAFGGALLAAAAMSAQPLAEVMARLTHVAEVVEPDHRQTGPLEDRYGVFLTELTRRGCLSSV